MTGTAWHTTGPFFPPAFISASDGDLTIGRDGAPVGGERIEIRGRIVDGEGAPVVNVIVELCQCDPAGQVPTAGDRFRGWGRVWTDGDGCYQFRTVKPGAARGRAPHLSLRLLGSGLMRPLETEAFFTDDPANRSDPQLAVIDTAVRDRLLLVPAPGSGVYRFDIRLRGGDETPFLEGR